MTTGRTDGARTLERRASRGAWLTIAIAVLATGALGGLLPAALASWATASPDVRPVSVRLDGTLSTSGLPARPAASLLVLHNDGPDPIRWTIDPRVEGAGRQAVSVATWVAEPDGCGSVGTLLRPGHWSATELAGGGQVLLCVQISDDGTGEGPALPTLSVHARAA